MSIPVAVNGASLLTPLTGVGQYTFNLMAEVEKDPDFVPHYFYGPMWDDERIDQMALEHRLKERLSERVQQSGIGRFPIYMQTVAMGLYARTSPSGIQQMRFNRGVKKQAAALYHEPNFVPYHFDGPIINTVHDLSILHFPEMHPKKRLKQIGQQLPAAIERSDIVITVSEFVAREVIDTFSIDASKVVAIHNGVNDHFRPRDELEVHECLEQQGLKYGRYLLAVGTLEPRKNIGNLVRAYGLLPSRVRRQFPLVIVGMKGWHYNQLTSTMKPLVDAGEIKMLGYLSEADLVRIYAGSTMLIYPSLYEGFGLPPLEAMACGVPVITSNRSSLPEVAGDAGVFVEPENVDEINEAILRLIDNESERIERGIAGLKRAQYFSWGKCAQETLEVYRRVLSF